MIKFILGFIVAIVIAGIAFSAYMFGKSETTSTIPEVNVVIPTTPVDSASSESTSGMVMAGTVMGKLCYPSEMIPPGKIEAKRTSDNMVFTQDYAGSQNGGGTTYMFDLEEGSYNLRFGVVTDGKTSSYGYHTTVCMTGLETTCGDANPRQLVPATVVAGQSIVGFDLCDFYYQPQNAPVF